MSSNRHCETSLRVRSRSAAAKNSHLDGDFKGEGFCAETVAASDEAGVTVATELDTLLLLLLLPATGLLFFFFFFFFSPSASVGILGRGKKMKNLGNQMDKNLKPASLCGVSLTYSSRLSAPSTWLLPTLLWNLVNLAIACSFLLWSSKTAGPKW